MLGRGTGVVVAAVALLFLAAGCGDGEQEQKQGTGPAGHGEQLQKKEEPVELVFYYPFASAWTEETFARTFSEPLRAKLPHISARLIVGGKIEEHIAAGTQIDVIYTSIGASPQQVLNVNLHHDISPYIRQFSYDTSKIDPMMLEVAYELAGGKGIYGLPVFTNPTAIYYNKDVFDRFGVAYPGDYLDWDALYEISKKLTRTDGGVSYYGFVTSLTHVPRTNQLSLPVVEAGTNKVVIDTAEWKRFAENLVRFYKLPGYETWTRAEMGEAAVRTRFFKDRTVGMWANVQALLETDVKDMNWDIAGFPVFKDKPGIGPQAHSVYFYVTSTSKHKEQAFRAIAELTSETYQMAMSKAGNFITALQSSAIKESFGQDNPVFRDKNVKALSPQSYAPFSGVNEYNLRADVGATLIDIALGDKDMNTAFRDGTERIAKNVETWESQKK